MRGYHPKIKLYCYYTKDVGVPTIDNSEPLGWTQLDVRDLMSRRVDNVSFELKGTRGDATPMILMLDARLSFGVARPPAAPTTREGPAAQAPEQAPEHGVAVMLPNALPTMHMDALPIGHGDQIFELELRLEATAGLQSLAPELEGMNRGFWFSYEILGMVLQSHQFRSLAAPDFALTCDTYRMKGSLAELAQCLERLSPLEIFLCSDDITIAAATFNLALSPEIIQDVSQNPSGKVEVEPDSVKVSLEAQRPTPEASTAWLQVPPPSLPPSLLYQDGR